MRLHANTVARNSEQPWYGVRKRTASAGLSIVLLLMELAACTPPAGSPLTTIPATSITSPPTTVAPTSTVPSTTVVTGKWIPRPLAPDEYVADYFVVDGSLQAFISNDVGDFRLLELGTDRRWMLRRSWNDFCGGGIGCRAILVAAVGPHWVFGVTSGDGSEQRSQLVPLDGAGDSILFDIIEAELWDMVFLDGRWVAVGADEMIRPAIWVRESDSWEPAALPDYIGSSGRINSAAIGAGGVVAAGFTNDEDTTRPFVLSSIDGVEWTLIDLPESGSHLTHPVQVAWDGTGFVITAADERGEAIWSSSDGRNWLRRSTDAATFGDVSMQGLNTQAFQGWTVVGGATGHRTNPLYCYDDIDSCRKFFTAVWLGRAGAWQRFQLPDSQEVHRVGTNGVVVSYATDEAIWTTSGSVDTLIAPSLDTSPPLTELPLARWGDSLTADVTYAMPLDVSCGGPYQLGFFNDSLWVTDEVKPIPKDYPMISRTDRIPPSNTYFGTAVLSSHDIITYSLRGLGVIAEYNPVSKSELIGCF